MLQPSQMTDEQLNNWLRKTVHTVNGFMYRGGSLNCDRGYDFADRYRDLMDEAKERDLWKPYCDDTGFDYAHTQYDLFA